MKKLLFILSLAFIGCSTEPDPLEETIIEEPQGNYQIFLKDCDRQDAIVITHQVNKITYTHINDSGISSCDTIYFDDLEGNEVTGHYHGSAGPSE